MAWKRPLASSGDASEGARLIFGLHKQKSSTNTLVTRYRTGEKIEGEKEKEKHELCDVPYSYKNFRPFQDFFFSVQPFFHDNFVRIRYKRHLL